MNPASRLPLAWRIAVRYVRTGERSRLVSFMSLLTIGGLALSVAILISVLSVLNGFEREMRETVLAILPQGTVSSEGGADAATRASLREQLLAHPDVLNVTPLVERVGVVATERSSKGVLAAGIDPRAEQDISPLGDYMSGEGFAALEQRRFQVLIGRTLADQLGAGVGDTLRLYSPSLSINPVTVLPSQRAFRVAGIFRVGTQELDGEMVLLREDDARILFRQAAADTGMRLQFRDVLQAGRVAAELSGELPAGWRISVWTSQFGAVYDNILLSRTIIGFLLWLLVAVAAFNLVVSLVMIVRDKTADIAILRTMGASPGLVARIFLCQGCLVGLAGTVIGLAGGVLLALSVTDLFRWFEQLSGTALLSADVYPVDYLPSQLQVGDVLLICGGVALLSLLASLYPALRAARMSPVEALRLE